MTPAPADLNLSDLGREAAREAARNELSKPEYHRDGPGWFARGVNWVIEHIHRLLDAASQHSPGGYLGLLALAALLVLVIVALRFRLGPLARSARLPTRALLGDSTLSAAEHRALADAFAAGGQWAEAVRERLRAMVRDLEELGVLEPRAGRTAAEVATDTRAALGAAADPLRLATRTFEEIWYGGRSATAEDDRVLREVAERLSTKVPV
jgi:hypothetical protein